MSAQLYWRDMGRQGTRLIGVEGVGRALARAERTIKNRRRRRVTAESVRPEIELRLLREWQHEFATHWVRPRQDKALTKTVISHRRRNTANSLERPRARPVVLDQRRPCAHRICAASL
jgi:hypothetical protein